ncbi:MAG: hypothetical protein K2N23_06100 [Clostridia bacterium]|nr:hypothetical protein [Clostridia bacterium]
MIGMIGSFVCLCIAVILRITLGSLTDKFEFLESWLKYFNYACIVFAVVTAIFICIAIFKAIRKK